jgi:uncharacterized membrane protein YgcG
MTRVPWDPAEIGSHDADLDALASRLEAYALEVGTAPDPSLAARINDAIDAEPIPGARWWQRGGGIAGRQAPVRLMAAAAVLVAGVVGGLALGEFAGVLDQSGAGSSPPAVTTPSPTPSPSASPSPSPTASPSPSPSPSESASPVSSARLPVPPVASDELETPDPDDVDNSGPGGGDDNSGSGGGGDNSGPGGGGDDSP